MEEPQFWQWLKEQLNQEKRKEYQKELEQFIKFPLWEQLCGLFIGIFCVLWWFSYPLFVSIPMSILHIILGLLLWFHGRFREKYTY